MLCRIIEGAHASRRSSTRRYVARSSRLRVELVAPYPSPRSDESPMGCRHAEQNAPRSGGCHVGRYVLQLSAVRSHSTMRCVHVRSAARGRTIECQLLLDGFISGNGAGDHCNPASPLSGDQNRLETISDLGELRVPSLDEFGDQRPRFILRDGEQLAQL